MSGNRLWLSVLLALSVQDVEGTAFEPACPGTVYNESGCGGTGAVVFNTSSAAECCDKCGGYSCTTWTYGGTSASEVITGFPAHNCGE